MLGLPSVYRARHVGGVADGHVYASLLGIGGYLRGLQLHIGQLDGGVRLGPGGACAVAAGGNPGVEYHPFSGIGYGKVLHVMIIVSGALHHHLHRYLRASRVGQRVDRDIISSRIGGCSPSRLSLCIVDISLHQVRAASGRDAGRVLGGQTDTQSTVSEGRCLHRLRRHVFPAGLPADLRRSQTGRNRELHGDAVGAVQIDALLLGLGYDVDNHTLARVSLQIGLKGILPVLLVCHAHRIAKLHRIF